MTSFQFTTMSIPTAEKDQPMHTAALEVAVLAVHERGEIRAREGVKIVRRSLRNSVSPEECMVEKQTAFYKMKCLSY
jgi:hypothetical protein